MRSVHTDRVQAILFCMGDLDAALNAPLPIVETATQATGSIGAATAMVSGLLVISMGGYVGIWSPPVPLRWGIASPSDRYQSHANFEVAVNLGSIASASRLTFAWARDGGLPAWFSYISPRHRIPVRAIWLPIVIVMVLACLNVGSTAAFGAFIALSSFALFTTYFIAIACMLRSRLQRKVQHGGWALGRWGVPINTFALIYTAYMSVFFVFPAFLPVAGTSMNYALPIFAFVVFVAVVLWFGWARKNWPGLNTEIIDTVLADSDRVTKESVA